MANPEGYSGYSLRAGLATAAGEAGADLVAVMRQTRHRSGEVALGYPGPPNSGATMPRKRFGRMPAVMSPKARDPRLLMRRFETCNASPVTTGNACHHWGLKPAADDG